jgi:hypothetical protein
MLERKKERKKEIVATHYALVTAFCFVLYFHPGGERG